MDNREAELKEKVEQITEWALDKGRTISFSIILDMLKYENSPIDVDDEIVNRVVYVLSRNGITVEVPGKDEDYEASLTEPDKFIPADVNISPRTLNVYNLMERLEEEEIDLMPGFQRHGGLWDDVRQSRLIESLMLRIPIPTFYFDASDDCKWKVIDGLQRLSAFENYLVGVKDERTGQRRKKKFKGLQYLKDFNDMTFDELPRQYTRRIKEAPVTVYVVEKGTPEVVVYNIFQRINTGGLRLEDQEIRQALYQGNATELTRELAESESFLEATQYSVRSERMLDREYVNRFLAFTELDYEKEYKGNIDEFLIKALKKVNNYTEEDFKRIRVSFQEVMEFSKEIFGRYAFRKIGTDGRRGPINKALFELWSVCFIGLTASQRDIIKKNKELFVLRFKEELLGNKEFDLALKSGDRYSCVKRIAMARKMMVEFYDKSIDIR